ncbi:MAG: GguC protein [Cyclobacteriaceae bacterium]
MIKLVQLQHPQEGRKVARVMDNELCLLKDCSSIYALALAAIEGSKSIESLVADGLIESYLEYNPIYNGDSKWKLLPSFDHPQDSLKCMLSGTGLTHKASAENRQAMHDKADEELTDSMKMYQLGVKGGQPTEGSIGVQPEWFYKGNGSQLRGHLDKLEVPSYAMDGGEEPEIAGVYVCDANGKPFRIGFTTANEFSDHIMEKQNYLYLAPSKIRHCAIGPELVVGAAFEDLSGKVAVYRDGKEVWSQNIKSGESNMAHNLRNLEYHHFKYDNHCQPELAHVHFFGADAFSFGVQIALKDGDQMVVNWQGFGRSLINFISISSESETSVDVGVL